MIFIDADEQSFLSRLQMTLDIKSNSSNLKIYLLNADAKKSWNLNKCIAHLS